MVFMYKVQKIILVFLIFTSLVAWLFSIRQPDMMMMETMITLNPIAVLIFTVSWTVGMAAMMFPAIVPMVSLYNRLIVGDNNSDYRFEISKQTNKRQFPLIFLFVNYSIKTIVFVASYLLVWSLTGILLLLSCSILMNNLLITYEIRDLDFVYGLLLVISGLYQFSSLKRKCLAYCESPLAFFTKRWKGNSIVDTIKMGWIVLLGMLLALFSVDGSIRIDEYNMDGSICWNNIWRKNMVKRNMDFKVYRNWFCYCRNSNYFRNSYIV
jgi:predicted metal-binding membrane protein